VALEIHDLLIVRDGFRLEIEYLRVERKTVLLGRNGAGKSTLLKYLMGFSKAVRGRTLIDGVNISNLPPEERPLGYIPQRLIRLPLSPLRQLEFFSRIHGSDYRPIVAKLGLQSLIEKRSLSIGETQLLTIATALLKNPRALLMDEPCANLDWPNKRTVLELVNNIEVPILYVTHDPFEALYLADEIALLEDKRLSGVYKNTAKNKVGEIYEQYDLYQLLKRM